jgi:DNA gyrase subunit A
VGRIIQSESDEIIYGFGINKLEGYLLFAFANGKIAKINIVAYETKTERKQLLNAFSTEAPLIFIKYVLHDLDIMVTGSTGKALIVNTSIINPLDTKSSRGVQILKLKPSTHAEKIYLLDEVDIQDISYYKRDAAAVGYYLKPEDRLIKKELIDDNIS